VSSSDIFSDDDYLVFRIERPSKIVGMLFLIGPIIPAPTGAAPVPVALFDKGRLYLTFFFFLSRYSLSPSLLHAHQVSVVTPWFRDLIIRG
jgi:hypothetical protein